MPLAFPPDSLGRATRALSGVVRFALLAVRLLAPLQLLWCTSSRERSLNFRPQRSQGTLFSRYAFVTASLYASKSCVRVSAEIGMSAIGRVGRGRRCSFGSFFSSSSHFPMHFGSWMAILCTEKARPLLRKKK